MPGSLNPSDVHVNKPLRRIMEEFSIHEISAVDRPAQVHAKMTILKRAPDLNETSVLKENTVDEETKKRLEDLEKSLASTQEALKKAEAERDEAAAKAKMTDDEKKFVEDKSEEEAKKFIAMTPEARQALMTAQKANDEVFKSLDGTEIRKSEVGAGVFAILKAQDERIRKSEEDVAKARAEAELSTLQKRASEELSALPGDVAAKAMLLREVAKMPEEVRKTAETILKAAQETAGLSLQSNGASDVTKVGGELDTLVKARAAKDNISFEKAMDLVLQEQPHLYNKSIGL